MSPLEANENIVQRKVHAGAYYHDNLLGVNIGACQFAHPHPELCIQGKA